MANYKLSGGAGLPAFPLASIFVDKYMPSANATFVKIYLYGLRLCYSVGAEVDNKNIASALGILESDVVLAWKYWEKEGVIRVNDDGYIEFVDLTIQKPPVKTSGKPRYKSKELACAIEENIDLALLFEHAQSIFGKTFSTNDASILYSFYDWLHLPMEVILILLEYCASLGKYNIRYAEKIAIDWASNGINTIDKAEEYLNCLHKKEDASKKYCRLFGIKHKMLSDAEYAHIVQWTENMQIPPELIKAAYEKAVLATGNPSFPYTNAILQSWHRKGIKDTSQLDKDVPKKTISKTKTNKFVDYEQTGEYDFEEIERKAMEKRLKRSAVGGE